MQDEVVVLENISKQGLFKNQKNTIYVMNPSGEGALLSINNQDGTVVQASPWSMLAYDQEFKDLVRSNSITSIHYEREFDYLFLMNSNSGSFRIFKGLERPVMVNSMTMNSPYSLSCNTHTREILVCCSQSKKIAILDLEGKYKRIIHLSGVTLEPRGIMVKNNLEILVCDSIGRKVDVYDMNGAIKKSLGQGLIQFPFQIMTNDDGYICVHGEWQGENFFTFLDPGGELVLEKVIRSPNGDSMACIICFDFDTETRIYNFTFNTRCQDKLTMRFCFGKF